MTSIVSNQLARLYTYLRWRIYNSARTTDLPSRRVPIPISGSSRGTSVYRPSANRSPSHDRGRKEGLSEVIHTLSHASDGDPKQKKQNRSGEGHVEKSVCKRFISAISITFFFVWTVLWTLLVITGAAFSLLIPNKWRRRRDICDEVVLVTNAGRGLGRRLAIVFALRAALVVCWDPDSDRHTNTVYDIRHRGGRALGFTVDVTDETAVINAVEVLKREVGPPHMLVMSSGRRFLRPLLHWTSEDLDSIYHVNVTPHLVLLRSFLPEMLARNYGHLVCIISASASVPCGFDAPYAATKMALAALMRGLSDELDIQPGNQIRLTCVYPCHTERRPSLAKMAEVVVDRVLRGSRSVVVPRFPSYCMGLIESMPLPARRAWRRFWASWYTYRKDVGSEREWPWGHAYPRHYNAVLIQTPPGDSVFKNAPYEMASVTNFDNVPLLLKKRKNLFNEAKDTE